ncbi:uncharacterized protein LOC128201594 [Galleria mellonella]|uniref:Uncharacterized protein LOC128201594 n=1 Tax=Galleria mellonella TaxID=7137 RepID=A0ABM3MUE2_GALME|nr:uncharacterized protein LOC128201594 [Galleria mellonella]
MGTLKISVDYFHVVISMTRATVENPTLSKKNIFTVVYIKEYIIRRTVVSFTPLVSERAPPCRAGTGRPALSSPRALAAGPELRCLPKTAAALNSISFATSPLLCCR